jgi:DNA repair protein RecO (recombination protein O)
VNHRERAAVTDGLVLRSVDYAEADRIVTLYTSDFGKVSLIARAARKSQRRFHGSLEPFAVIKAELKLGTDELGIINKAQMTRPFASIIKDYTSMKNAGAGLELVRLSTPEREPDREIFQATVALLDRIDKSPELGEQTLISFQVQVMKLVGFAPCFDVCGMCHNRARDSQPGHFDPRAGFMVCRRCGQAPVYLGASTRQRLIIALGPDWRGAQDAWSAEQLQQAREAMSQFIAFRFAH